MIRASWIVVVACSTPVDHELPQPPVLVDTNPDPAIVEVSLVAEPATLELLPGTTTDVWAFRDAAGTGSIPGPLLEAKLGDRVIVHFENRLPVATTIHWHGLRVPNAADGTPSAQLAIEPGARFDYVFDAIDAGLYWYHPHVEADVQIERGLYAPIRIADTTAIDVAADRVLVLDDVKLDASGALSETTDRLDMMLGRQGNVLLVNGRVQPTLVAAGTRERWRIVNVANGRYFHLDLPGHRFTVIGWDGGLLPGPYEAETLLVAPGERYDVIVELAADTTLRNIYYDRGHDIPDPGPKDLMIVRAGPATEHAALPPGPAIAPIDTAGAPEVMLTLREIDDGVAMPSFTINDEAFPDTTPVLGEQDAVAVWNVVNDTEMDHPFHLHGMAFQIEDDRLGWKDTVNIPQKQTRRLRVRYGGAGRWMFHCHILEHAERGMMSELVVSPRL
ncbi:MAG TPA: multicopper oxidase family protein [Kofleriaceae bacterium]|nr:multicopper oxidase family protein [Kofleriaceae bacterium]